MRSATLRLCVLAGMIALGLGPVGPGQGAGIASRTASGSHPVGITSDYLVGLGCSEQTIAAGSTCAKSAAPVPYVSPALHPDVFEAAATAASSAPGSGVQVWFYNSACAASPEIRFLVTSASKTVAVGVIPSVPASQWAGSALDFAMPNVGQVRSGSAYRGASFAISFSGTVAACEAGYGVVRGFFGVSPGGTPPKPCGAQASTRKLAGATASSFATVDACPLIVKVTGALSLTSGLDRRSASFFDDNGRCLSGCTDLVVTVTDRSQKVHGRPAPVANASVQVSVQPVPKAGIAFYPFFDPGSVRPLKPGAGYLCDALLAPGSKSCGPYLDKLKTDDKGQVKLRYWAPGVTAKQQVLVTANAQEACTTGGCPAREKHGTTQPSPTLTIEPNVLIGTAAAAKPGSPPALTDYERFVMKEWSRPQGIAKFAYDQKVDDLITHTIGFLLTEEASTAYTAVTMIGSLGSPADREEVGFVAAVLNHFHVEETGLGATDLDTSEPLTYPIGEKSFQDEFGKIVRGYGQSLLDLDQVSNGTIDPRIYLRVFEVSFCSEGEQCGAGYTCGTQRCPGIKPFLVFELDAFRPPQEDHNEFVARQVFSMSIITPYRADTWLKAQKLAK